MLLISYKKAGIKSGFVNRHSLGNKCHPHDAGNIRKSGRAGGAKQGIAYSITCNTVFNR